MLIAIAHQKGGVGKSTIAINLAIILSKKLSLSVIDLDSQHSVKLFSTIRKKERGESMSVYTPETIEELKELLKMKKHFIVDSGGYDNDLNRFVLANANLVITPVAPSQIEVFGLLKFQKIIEKALKVNPKLKVFVVINNALPQSVKRIQELRKFIEEETPFDVLDTVIHRRIDYQVAYMEGLSVCELNPKGKACSEFILLLKELFIKFISHLKQI
jgi:chromosome partitioning protein